MNHGCSTFLRDGYPREARRGDGRSTLGRGERAGVKMKTFFLIVGVLVAIGFLVQTSVLTGQICIQSKCVGTLGKGVHLGDRSDFVSGTRPATTTG